MQFIVIANDLPDAAERRKAARPAHLEMIAALRGEGRMLYAAGMMDEAGAFNGSMIVCDFEDRAALEAWLSAEPYVVHRVWGNIDIRSCAVPPAFLS